MIITHSTNRGFLFCFGLFWSTGVCLFLGLLAYGVFNQWRALSFASTQGVVDSIGRTVNDRRAAQSYGDLNIDYHYSVAGRRYEGDRMRYMQSLHGPSYDAWASDMMSQFARGTHPMVFYNPNNPAEAVLVRGIQAEDLFSVLFMMPFTMVLLPIWFSIVRSFRKSEGFVGLRILDEGTITQIRPSAWSAVGAAAIGLGVSALVCFLIVGVRTEGHPSFAVAEEAWGVVLIITVVAGLAKFANIRSGSRDIILNPLTKTLQASKGVSVSYRDIQHLFLAEKIIRGKSTVHTYELWLAYTQGNETKRLKLKKGRQDQSEVRRLADWIAEKVCVSVEKQVQT